MLSLSECFGIGFPTIQSTWLAYPASLSFVMPCSLNKYLEFLPHDNKDKVPALGAQLLDEGSHVGDKL
jgi:hypothetical protein